MLLASAALFAFLYTTATHDARQNVDVEAMTVLMQLVAIGIIGGLVTWALNERRDKKEHEAQRQEALNEFRRKAVARLVTATNAVRRAPILIAADRSKKTYGEQGRRLLDANLGLRLLHHEIETTKGAFEESESINRKIRCMQSYIDYIVMEWEDCYRKLPDPPSDAWNQLSNLEALKDLLKGVPPQRRGQKPEPATKFKTEYIDNYEAALRSMRRDIFGP